MACLLAHISKEKTKLMASIKAMCKKLRIDSVGKAKLFLPTYRIIVIIYYSPQFFQISDYV